MERFLEPDAGMHASVRGVRELLGARVRALENGACFVSKMTLCSDYDEALLAAGEDMFVKEKE